MVPQKVFLDGLVLSLHGETWKRTQIIVRIKGCCTWDLPVKIVKLENGS